MREFIEKLNKLEEYIASSLLIITSLLVFIQVVFRYFFNFSIAWSEEVSKMFIVWFIFLGSSICVREKAHVNMDAVYVFSPPIVKAVLEILATIVCLIFCAYVIRSGFGVVANAYKLGSTATSVKIPLYVPYAAVPVGLTLMLLRYLVQLKDSVISFKNLVTK